mgnify:CR=1 FL=1
MEKRRNQVNNRINSYAGYQYGSAVRKVQTAAPQVRPYNPSRQEEKEQERRTRREIRRNNRMNLRMSLTLLRRRITAMSQRLIPA